MHSSEMDFMFVCQIWRRSAFILYSFSLEHNNTWPVIYKSGEKQMANLLWYNEGLFVDLPHGYVDDLTQVYDSSGTIKADYF